MQPAATEVSGTQVVQRGQAPQEQELGRAAVHGPHTCSCLSRGARKALVDVQLRTKGLQEQALLLTLLLQERH